MHRLVFLLLFVGLSTAIIDEHWFAFDLYQFPGFYTPLFTLISPANTEQQRLTFALSTYERSIVVNIGTGKFNETNGQEQLIRLNIERADLLYNTLNHLIFVAVRQRTKLETYVNCKLIDSYLLYGSLPINERENDNNNNESFFKIQNLTDGVNYFQNLTADQQKIFDKFGCKQSSITTILDQNKTSSTATIARPLIRKMQHVIEKVQRRKQRSRRHQQQSVNTDSFTVIYMPNIDKSTENETIFRTILNISRFAFHIRYYPNEHLFQIRLNNENRTQFVLYADKTTDLVHGISPKKHILSTVVLFLHITPSIITCYVNCEMTDQEFILDSISIRTIIRQTMSEQQQQEKFDSNRQSTLIIFNKTIEQIAANFFCLKLDKKNEELLPDKYALRKFSNALDMLVNTLDSPASSHSEPLITSPILTSTHRISAVSIPSINGFSSLIAPSSNEGETEIPSMTDEFVKIDQSCTIDRDCGLNSFMQCQIGRCTCPSRSFWSTTLRRCISCKDLSIGNRCFRLSNHKATWYEANEYCQDETTMDEQQQQEYTMKMASNLNRTDIELIKHSLLQQDGDDDSDHLDYFYWLGAMNNFDTRKLHQQQQRNKRDVPTTIFRWYDTGETAQLSTPDIWCSQANDLKSNTNELCVSLTSCGLYADDCQRNYRFLCEAI